MLQQHYTMGHILKAVRHETIQAALQQYEGDYDAVVRALQVDTLDTPDTPE
jgi:hypothetical protein